MALLKCGQRKVWLDPEKKNLIAKAKTREAIRELIVKDVIQIVPTRRGKRTGSFRTLQAINPTLRGIKKRYAEQHGLDMKKEKKKAVEEFVSPEVTQEELL